MADDDFDMYDVEENEETVAAGGTVVAVNKLPMTTELRIGDKVVVTVNPEYVNAMQRKMLHMESRMAKLENELRNLQSNIRNKEATIERLRNRRGEDEYE